MLSSIYSSWFWAAHAEQQFICQSFAAFNFRLDWLGQFLGSKVGVGILIPPAPLPEQSSHASRYSSFQSDSIQNASIQDDAVFLSRLSFAANMLCRYIIFIYTQARLVGSGQTQRQGHLLDRRSLQIGKDRGGPSSRYHLKQTRKYTIEDDVSLRCPMYYQSSPTKGVLIQWFPFMFEYDRAW